MNSKKLVALVVVLICLVALFYSLEPANHKGSSQRQEAFPDIADKVARLVIEKGTDSVELKVENNRWVVPARSGYFADGGKINALILRIAALNLFQKVTDNTERHYLLGVGADPKKSGKLKVSFFDRDNNSLGGIYIGEQSKSNSPAKEYGISSYYVRREGDNNVYLVGESLAVKTDPEYWLSTQILNIEQTAVKHVRQATVSGEAKLTDFEIERNPDIGEEEMFRLVGAESGKDGNAEVVGLIAAGLVNLRFDDVVKVESEIGSALNFDRITEYSLVNGMQYQVSSAYKDGNGYIKINVSFDKTVAEAVKSNQSSSSSQQTSSDSSFDGVKEAERQNGQFSGWIFRVPEYIGTKFRKTLVDVSEKKSENN